MAETTEKYGLCLAEIVNNKVRTFADELALLEEEKRINGTANNVFANNGTSELEEKDDATFVSIEVLDKDNKAIGFSKTFNAKNAIKAGEKVTIRVTLKKVDEIILKRALNKISFSYWIQETYKGKTIPLTLTPKIIPLTGGRTEDLSTNPLIVKEGEDATSNIAQTFFQVEKKEIDIENAQVSLTVRFSKWLDSYCVRIEAHKSIAKVDGGKTTASRYVSAQPQILEAYWMNAEAQKVNYAGYEQDLYLYLKTLGLKDKEIEVQVHEQDYYQEPSIPLQFPLSGQSGDELIDWKNNQIKIDTNGEALKQFKVGNKKRYEEAQKDEKDDYDKWYNDQISQGNYLAGIDPSEKYSTDLDLYIHFPEKGDLKLDKNNKFAKLTLTEKTMILDAYFANEKKEKVQADATQQNIKNKKGKVIGKKTATKKVTHYQKLDKGVLGQTVQLVAECPNLEGKKVAFQVFEKTPLLEEKEKPLTLINKKGEEKTRIETKVNEGFAVAEVKLQHCKEDADNEDWLDLLKNGFTDTKGKTAELYIKVEATEQVFTVKDKGVFLKDSPFKMIGNNWHEPVKNPERTIYNSSNNNSPRSGAFGGVRRKWNKTTKKTEIKNHGGVDIFAPIGTNVYACLDGEIVFSGTKGTAKTGYGHTVILKVTKEELDNRECKINYNLTFKSDGEIEKGPHFGDSDNRYLLFTHLKSINVVKDEKVKCGKIIGIAGKSGLAYTVKNPSNRHLHFEVLDSTNISNYYKLHNRKNASFYIDFVTANKSVQKNNKD